MHKLFRISVLWTFFSLFSILSGVFAYAIQQDAPIIEGELFTTATIPVRYVVRGNGVNIRSAPGTSSSIIGVANTGEHYALVDHAPTEADGLDWYHISLEDGKRGFIAISVGNSVLGVIENETVSVPLSQQMVDQLISEAPPDTFTISMSDINITAFDEDDVPVGLWNGEINQGTWAVYSLEERAILANAQFRSEPQIDSGNELYIARYSLAYLEQLAAGRNYRVPPETAELLIANIIESVYGYVNQATQNVGMEQVQIGDVLEIRPSRNYGSITGGERFLESPVSSIRQYVVTNDELIAIRQLFRDNDALAKHIELTTLYGAQDLTWGMAYIDEVGNIVLINKPVRPPNEPPRPYTTVTFIHDGPSGMYVTLLFATLKGSVGSLGGTSVSSTIVWNTFGCYSSNNWCGGIGPALPFEDLTSYGQ